jgi:hypothetical protein
MTRISLPLLPLAAALLLLGCSTSQPPMTPAPEVIASAAPLPAPVPEIKPQMAKACQLGTSCLTLDPRPFELCLVAAGKRCVDKATEPLLVTEPQPPSSTEPPLLETSSE